MSLNEDKVRNFMKPTNKFPMIPDTATFAAAVLALEKAQDDYMTGKRECRTLLVYDQNDKIVGKLTPIDVVRGLEPQYESVMSPDVHPFMRNVQHVLDTMRERAVLWSKPIDDLCASAQNVRIKDFIQAPLPSQIVQAEESLNLALHHFVAARHDTLFVLDGKKLVGMLRFSDVYREIARRLKDVCRI